MGSGKTMVCLITLILLCRAFPKSKWCVIRESIPTLKRTTLESFKKIVPQNFVADYNQQDQIYTFANGSQIMFMAENYTDDKDFDRFKGLEVNGFLLEQLEELQLGLFKMCYIRAGRHVIEKMPRPIILANVNPTLTWPKEEVYERYLNGTLPPDWYYEPAKISDNPILFNDELYMQNITAHLDPITKARLIDGDWTAFAVNKPYFYNFSLQKHVIDSYTPNPHLPLLISFDFNIEPMTATVSQSVDLMNSVTFDELKIPQGSVEEMCELIKAKYTPWLGNIDITGDATGRNREKVRRGNINAYKLIKEELGLYDRNILVPSVNLPHKDSRVLCTSVLQHSGWRITKNCKETINDCVFAQVDDQGDLIKTKDQGRHCFVGNTLVTTKEGYRCIQSIKAGEYVLTRDGFNEVLERFDNGQCEVFEYELSLSDGSVIKLECTSDHLVFTTKGWLPISRLLPGMMVVQHKCLEDTSINYTNRTHDILYLRERKRQDYMWMSGQTFMGNVPQKDSMFIMWMMIRRIITQIICNYSEQVNICQTTLKREFKKILYTIKRWRKGLLKKLLNGVRQRKAYSLDASMSKMYYLKHQNTFLRSPLIKFVKIAGNSIKPNLLLEKQQDFAKTVAKVHGEERADWMMRNEPVNIVEQSLSQTNTLKLINVHVTARGKQQVYDLCVDTNHEYFANGLLVHNCFDNVRYTLATIYPDFIKNPRKYR